MPLAQDVQVAGLTTEQVRRSIAEALSTYIRDPNVTVIVTDFIGRYDNQIRVVGRAAQPQAIAYRSSMTLLDVMISVGGLAVGLAVLPVARAHQVQQHLQQRAKVLREHLHSTVVIVRDPLAEVVLNGCFALFPPTRPIKVLCQTCAGPLTDACTQQIDKFFRKRKLDQTAGAS